jgi:FtsZ-interacting cell division protein ZipA
MPQLRWILLAAGVVFCVALWWWETRRRGHRTETLRRVETFRTFEPASDVNSARDHDYSDTDGYSHDSDDRDDDRHYLGDEPHELSGVERPAARRIEPTFEDPAEFDAERTDPALDDEPTFEPESQPESQKEQKIVSLRLLAAPERLFGGRDLREALQGAGLVHGKFSIFHRQTSEGVAIFSVASLTEPGSFDLQTMDRQQFRGVTFFAVLADAGEEGVGDMRQIAQGIAAQLHGTLSGGR